MPQKVGFIHLLFAIFTLAYCVFAVVSGKVSVYKRAGLSETISIDVEPERFWGVVLLYVGMAVIMVILSIKKYFPKKLYELIDFGIHSKLSILQVIFLISFTALTYSTIFWLAGVLANT
ncbi:hypothetical protein Misp06_02549 [Microbulbifer sp. NBRC 101763]|uniref:hypothetical protein n=1 Tax=Microbulbifer sp. NBRC 101763 TaxID=1113820 RepID=UPI0030AFB29D